MNWLIFFCKGMWNTPGMIALKQEFKQDKQYRYFILFGLLVFVLEIAFFSFFI